MNSQAYQKLVDAVNILTEAARNESWCDGWDAGHTTGTKIAEQKAELNSGNIYWDGFTEGLVQGKLEAELKREEKSLIKSLRKIFGG